jgi:hypothetical protein
VFIGYDPLEDKAAKMLAHSIRSRTNMKLGIFPIIRDQLLAYDICDRPIDPMGSTQFSITRFLVPHLMGYQGVGVFMDCDMLITRNILEVFDAFDPSKAIQCPQHDYTPKFDDKMGGIPQTVYPRKQWSAFTIYNCDHPVTKQLTNTVVETASPKYLHRFEWCPDEYIGDLPLDFNFLVGEQDKPEKMPMVVHHTLGAPLFAECQDVDYADYWKEEFKATFGRPFSHEDIIN